MGDTNQSSSKGMGGTSDPSKLSKSKSIKSRNQKNNQAAPQSNGGEVLLKVGALKYKMPGKRQRIIIASIVLGLNGLLALAVLLYFYSPSFHEFIYTVGRN